MFHFCFDLEDSMDETIFLGNISPTDQGHEVASPPQQTGEPFSEIDLESLVCMANSLRPYMHPHSRQSSLARSITDPNILLLYLYFVTRQ